MACVCVNDIDVFLTDQFGKAPCGCQVQLGTEWEGVAVKKASPVFCLEKWALGACGYVYLVAPLKKSSDEPARLLFTAAPLGLFVYMEHFHR